MSGDLIIPGDFLPIDTDSSIKTTIGPGIYKNPQTQSILPTNAGLINIQKSKAGTNQLVYIESNSKRYTPQTNDFVIGIVTGVIGESYKVQLQDFSPAVLLSMMAFPNATKKNRPNLKIGQAVYARVSEAIPEIETELECIDPTTGKEGGFGLLDESGYIFEVNLNFARELLFNANSIFLEKLASKCKFEIAVGINGKVWIKCGEGIKIEKDRVVPEEGKPVRDNTRDLKSTLAAAGFLVKCQKLRVDQIDAELQKQFKNI
ncbi:Exosome complex exonuclease RRP40 (Ribosomal RNA processing protein 40) [Scheffersomyces stipitis CBS 6054]|uniref:Exosome complex exonuclease RRP40 (Ribosomal RNA processing protein 40) n=1 Tax=Scheffersomyces stipitis (strain ATCC 58785 / CBS 6054 / NBRC 10063 / NRRL Y-11545) TaxID=322104 RepID=A3GFJ8_PICST|nr:exosome complex component RRP40 [Scheffersomyces stipitis CBS 6054]EAZ63360.1 Exosome complex exonuclease RRP40 (Ribosomal RNA processing protein 40) [Scheffersomyces stipitis CBS 6054]